MTYSPPSSDAPPRWSRQIQAKYQCVLPPDLTHWFDHGIWELVQDLECSNAFSHPISPNELLDDAPESIWPALMPCDFLPVLGNDAGDWLCIRFGANNSVAEIVHWYHGGGDWIPWGKSLADAVLFDHLRCRLPGFDRDHAIAAEPRKQPGSIETDVLVCWATGHVSQSEALLAHVHDGQKLVDAMDSVLQCEPAICCQLVIDALDNAWLNGVAIKSHAKDPDEYQRWMFDNALIPREVSDALLRERDDSDVPLSDHQQWDTVAKLCGRVVEKASHLGWAWELLGYAAERNGDPRTATANYLRGLACSVFSDQTVRVRTHGFNAESQKFSATRLFELGYEADEPSQSSYLECLSTPSAHERRERVRIHFTKLAMAAEGAGDHDAALGYWMRAGWDLGAEPMIAFAELLDHVVRAGNASGKQAIAAIARTHRACFKDRYRI